MNRTIIIINVVTFLVVAFVAIQMKGSISHERTNTSERINTMLKKARYLENTGDFIEAGSAYSLLAKNASPKDKAIAERGRRRMAALALVSRFPMDAAALAASNLLVAELQADGGDNAVVAALLLHAVAIADGQEDSIDRLVADQSLVELAPWKDWLLGAQYFYAGHALKAVPHLEEVVTLQKKYMPGFLLYGNALSLTGDVSGAVTALESALSLGAGRDGYGSLGRAHLRAQQWPEAVKNLDRAHTLGKPEIVLQKELGFALFQMGSFAQSARAYRGAYTLDRNPSTLLMAVLSLRKGKMEEEALRLLQDIDADAMPRALYERGRALAEIGRTEEARAVLMQYVTAAEATPAERLRVQEIKAMLE